MEWPECSLLFTFTPYLQPEPEMFPLFYVSTFAAAALLRFVCSSLSPTPLHATPFVLFPPPLSILAASGGGRPRARARFSLCVCEIRRNVEMPASARCRLLPRPLVPSVSL